MLTTPLPRPSRRFRTAAPVHALPAAVIRPVFIRLPKPGTLCPYTNLSRSKMWSVLQTRKVRNACLRNEGATKGARLIHLESLLQYLNGLAQGGNETEAGSQGESVE